MLTRRQLIGRCAISGGALLVAACAPSREAPQSPPTSARAAGAPAISTAPAAIGAGQYKLDLGGYRGPALTAQNVTLRLTRQVYPPVADKWWKDMYAQWADAYPNIQIHEETVPYGDLNQKLQTYVAAGDPPDIIMGKGDFVQGYVANGITLNMSDHLTDEFLNDISPAILAQQSVDGKLYAMPWEQGQTMMFFNKDMFERAGVAVPADSADLSEAWTWDQAAEIWNQLTVGLNSAAEPSIYALASSYSGNGGPGSSYWYEGIYIRSMGDARAPRDSSMYRTFEGVSDNGLTASGYVDTPEAVKGMEFYQSIFQRKFSPTVAVGRMFEDQNAATRFGAVSQVAGFKNPDTGVKFAWGALPVPKGNELFTHISGDSPIASAKTKYPAEVMALLGFMHNDKNRVEWHYAWGNLPARQSLFGMIPMYAEFPYSLAVRLTQAGHAVPLTPGYLEYFSAMNTAVKDIALGASATDRLHKVAKEIDGLLANYKK